MCWNLRTKYLSLPFVSSLQICEGLGFGGREILEKAWFVEETIPFNGREAHFDEDHIIKHVQKSELEAEVDPKEHPLGRGRLRKSLILLIDIYYPFGKEEWRSWH